MQAPLDDVVFDLTVTQWRVRFLEPWQSILWAVDGDVGGLREVGKPVHRSLHGLLLLRVLKLPEEPGSLLTRLFN